MVVENAACAARFIAVGQEEIIIAFGLEAGVVSRIMGVAGGFERGVEIARVFMGWRARAASIGVRSSPPPNQFLVVTTMRVFICAVVGAGWQDGR